MKKRQYKTIEYILLGLVPYTVPNLKLSFTPSKFFYELEKISNSNEKTLRSTLSRAQKQGFVEKINGIPVLTRKGLSRIQPYQTKKLNKKSLLMIIFDIPEENKEQRRKLRNYLKYLHFQQVQKSVWVSDMDYRDALKEVIIELDLDSHVQLFESAKLYPKN